MTPFVRANSGAGGPFAARRHRTCGLWSLRPQSCHTSADGDGRTFRSFQHPDRRPNPKKSRSGRNDMRKFMIAAALTLPMFGGAAMAQETIKIGYIDPLSGG